MDTISHDETSSLGKFYMHQENNVPFMTKNVNFALSPWTLLGHSQRNTDISAFPLITLVGTSVTWHVLNVSRFKTSFSIPFLHISESKKDLRSFFA